MPPSLQLDLSYNRLCGVSRNGFEKYTVEGITAIAGALRVNASLTSIDLRANNLGDEGWGAILGGICSNKDSKITSIHASGEEISRAGAKLIAEALRTSVTTSLTKLDVSFNSFIKGEEKAALQKAVEGRSGFELIL